MYNEKEMLFVATDDGVIGYDLQAPSSDHSDHFDFDHFDHFDELAADDDGVVDIGAVMDLGFDE